MREIISLPLLLLTLFLRKMLVKSIQTDYYFDVYPVNAINTTVIISQSIDLGKCICDLTPNTCDYLCCCDPDCTSDQLNIWNNSTDLICKNYNKYDIYLTSNCAKKDLVYNYNKNVGLIQYYDPFTSLFCVSVDNSNEMGIFYNSLNETNSQFLSFTQQNANNMILYYQRYILNTGSTPNEESVAYEVDDPLRITPNKINNYTNVDSLFLIYEKGIYGDCRRSGTVKFMVNIPEFSCGLIIPQLSQCKNYGYEKIFSRQISSAPLTSSRSIPIRINSIYIKNLILNTLINTNGSFPNTTFLNGSVCTCNNILLESRYTFIMNQNNNTLIELVLDLILGDTISGNCQSNYILQQTFSYKFTTSVNNIARSGNPGYLVNSYLLIGTNRTLNGNVMFTVKKNGFYIQGRANDGSCANIGGNTLYTNFDFPIKFGDNVIYSCSMTYNQKDFNNFCSSQNWKQFVIYNMVNDIQYVGIFGNSNYTYLKDWLIVQNDINLDNFSYFSSNSSCYFPAVIKLDLLYAKAGSIENSQNYIVSARLYTSNLTYAFISSIGNVTVKIYFIINYVYLDRSYFVDSKYSNSLSFSDLLPKNIADPFILG